MCKYCNVGTEEYKPLLKGDTRIEICENRLRVEHSDTGYKKYCDDAVVNITAVDIEFCPKCGKRLKDGQTREQLIEDYAKRGMNTLLDTKLLYELKRLRDKEEEKIFNAENEHKRAYLNGRFDGLIKAIRLVEEMIK